MREQVVLITGANGEIGHGLIRYLAEQNCPIVTLDVNPLDKTLRPLVSKWIVGDVLDQILLGRLVVEHQIRTIYHLASILSTKAEYNPETAHRINVEGTLNLLRLAVEQSQWQGQSVKFIYPSSIAVYGMPSLEEKRRIGKVKEGEYTFPTTMYGCNKLYCCLLYTSDAADDLLCVDLGGRRIIKKKNHQTDTGINEAISTTTRSQYIIQTYI